MATPTEDAVREGLGVVEVPTGAPVAMAPAADATPFVFQGDDPTTRHIR